MNTPQSRMSATSMEHIHEVMRLAKQAKLPRYMTDTNDGREALARFVAYARSEKGDIWIVHGTTGEYSDRSEWVVDAWPSEAAAKARVEFLTRRIQELGIERQSRYEPKWDAACAEMRKEDAAFNIDYTGTEYYVSQCPLKDVPHER